MRSIRTLLAALSLLVATTALGLPVGAFEPTDLQDLPSVDAPTATPNWASVSSAAIRPGVQMVTSGSQCTSNFIYYEQTSSNPIDFDIYIGYAAHCAGTGGATSTNGCTTGSRALGTPVSIEGALHAGSLAYSSWRAMQQPGATPTASDCSYNDFALVKIDSRDHYRVSPSVLHFGGPTALCANPTSIGQYIMSYGNSGLRFNIDVLSPKVGTTATSAGGGWSTNVYMMSPGIPGDSGSGYMNASHCAWGVTSTLQIAPLAGSNGIGSIQKALAYAAANGGPSVTIGTAAPITSLPI